MKTRMSSLVVLSFTLALPAFVGCNSDGVTGDPEETEETILERHCARWAECSPTEFESYYSSVNDCLEGQIEQADYYLAIHGTACRDGWIERLQCVGRQSCDPPADYCQAETDWLEANCL
ncbi:MAG: hypothetical protein ABI333_09785 [bacterium]